MSARIDRWFVATGLLFAFAGLIFAARMGETRDQSQMFTHAHLMVVGFLMSSVYGLFYRGWSSLKSGWAPVVHFSVHTLGAILLATSLFLFASGSTSPAGVPMVIAATVLLLLGVVLFFVDFLRRGERSGE